MDRERFEPYVMMAEEGPARMLFEAEGAQVEVVVFPRFWTSPGPRWYARASWEQLLFFRPAHPLRKRLVEIQPSIIHVNDKAAAPAGWALRDLGIPIVQHLRSSYFTTLSRLNKWVSIKIMRHYADAFIAISEDELDGFDDLPHEVIYNSIDLQIAEKAGEHREQIRHRNGIEKTDFLVGYMGLVSPIRGIWNFLELASLLCDKAINGLSPGGLNAALPTLDITRRYKFIAVGALPQAETLKGQLTKSVKRLGLTDSVVFTGFQADSLAYLAAFDVLAVCNEQGVLGRPPFEALAVGTPSVAFTGHSGKSRILVDGLTSKIVSRGDVAGLAEAVKFLVENPSVYEEMREAARAYAMENFSPEKNALKVMAVYEQLLFIAPTSISHKIEFGKWLGGKQKQIH